MTVVAADVEYRYSGGAGNTSPGASLGGAMSTAGGGTIDDAVLHDLFDQVSSAESVAGDVEYRGFYVGLKGTAVGSLTTARIFILSDSANAGDIVDLAIADEAKNGAMETIANESTAPVGPTFTHPTTYAGGIDIDAALVANDERGVWIRRTITAGASPGTITNTLRVQGDTV